MSADRRPASSKLRHKLTAIFVLLAALGGLVGAAGLYYVNRVRNTVTVLNETTSPMIATMAGLIETSLHFKMMVFHGVDAGRSAQELRAARTELHEATHHEIDRMRSQIVAAGVDIDIDEAERLATDFAEALDRMIEAHDREQSLKARLRIVATSVRTTVGSVDRQLQSLIQAAEAEVALAEARTKTSLKEGEATVAALGEEMVRLFNHTHQNLEMSRRLYRVLKEISDTRGFAANVTTPAQLDELRATVLAAVQSGDDILDSLAGRLRTGEERLHHRVVEADFARLKNLMVEPYGVIALEKAAREARLALASGRTDVLTIERAYFRLLETVRQAVERLNATTRQEVDRTIAQAGLVFGVSLALSFAVAVLLAHLMARRIAQPLTTLTRHVAAIGESGDPVPLRDDAVTGRADEIGTLARAFNATCAELAEARRQLIAQSREEVRIQYERLDAAVSNMAQGLSMFDRDRRLVVCNARWAELYGVPPEMTQPGTPFSKLLDVFLENCEVSPSQTAEDITASAWDQFTHRHRGIYQLKNGRTVALSRVPIPGGGAITTHEDITERCRAEEQIAHMAMHDMLTDLPNRVSFRKALTTALERVHRGEETAVLYFDLDHFKRVNDGLGHPVGDALLKAVAQRLRACVRETDSVARLGGDEFAIVQSALKQPGNAAELASRLVHELSRPYEIDGQTVVIGASVGIALAPQDGEDPDTLLRNADMALYRSKALGRGTYSFFEPAMDAQMQERRELEIALRQALAAGDLTLHYQPLVNAATGKVGGLEALLRWFHPQRGAIPPATFIPVAEETGLMGELGAFVLREACKAATGWPEDVRVAVNLSAKQFAGGRVLEDVEDALTLSGLTPARLELEITEAMLMQDTGTTVAILKKLHTLGVRISMDDFGTGSSSLGYLRKFAFDKIKIDRSFVRDLGVSRDATAIVRAVNGLATALGIETVAEGVETGEQFANALREGCSEIQGDIFNAAVPLADVETLLARDLLRNAA